MKENPANAPLLADAMAAIAKLERGERVDVSKAHPAQDLQISAADARLLAQPQPKAKFLIIQPMNHVLKDVPSGDRAANLKSYSDPSLPINTNLVEAIAAFVRPEI